MQITVNRTSEEPAAKAALLEYLRKVGRLGARSSAVLELGIAKLSNRADVAVVDQELHCFEIKTRRDSLMRLSKQVEAYSAAADSVTVVAATKHINAILSRLPIHVGILEIVDFGSGLAIRPIREAATSPLWSSDNALALLPVVELRRLLAKNGLARREQMVVEARSLPKENQRAAVAAFLKTRYYASTRTFLEAVRRREVRPEDLAMLRIWERNGSVGSEAKGRTSSEQTDADDALYRQVGRSFGPVPDEIRRLLANRPKLPQSGGYYLRRSGPEDANEC